jgi:hypothetical protein
MQSCCVTRKCLWVNSSIMHRSEPIEETDHNIHMGINECLTSCYFRWLQFRVLQLSGHIPVMHQIVWLSAEDFFRLTPLYVQHRYHTIILIYTKTLVLSPCYLHHCQEMFSEIYSSVLIHVLYYAPYSHQSSTSENQMTVILLCDSPEKIAAFTPVVN